MIAQNEINVLEELANKNDNHTFSYKHRKGGFYNKLNNDACTIVSYPTLEDKHIWQVYVTNELKIKLFCFFTIRAMVWILITMKNRYLNTSPVLKFDSRWTKRSRNEVMQPTPSRSDSWPIFPYLAHNQAGFDNAFINDFIYLGISKLTFTF